MSRLLHRYLALPASILILVLAISGVALSVFPAFEAATTPSAPAGMTAADLAARVKAQVPQVQQIKVAPSGKVTAYYFAGLSPAAKVIDPATGAVLGDKSASRAEGWLVDLHRSLFLGAGGRIAAGAGAGLMLLVSLTGIWLLARRMGGWRKLLAPARGTLSARLHVELGRLALIGLVISSVTGLWMTLTLFEIIPIPEPTPVFPSQVSGQIAADLSGLEGLRTVPLSELRTLTFPYDGDATDVFTIETRTGMGYVDQGTGQTLSFETLGTAGRIGEFFYALHTGRGMWFVGVLLGLSALAGSVLTVTGIVIWWRNRRAAALPRGFDKPARAQTVILVGSEGGSTWGFATTLGRALKDAGQSVHVARMSGFAPARWKRAERVIVLTSTYGNGDAPRSARGFEAALARASRAAARLPVAVLGFGDNSYPQFCGYAREVKAELDAHDWPALLPLGTINRQSAQEFARWGRDLGAALGIELTLTHVPSHPSTRALTLIERRDYGQDLQEPTAILRFALPRAGLLARLTGRGFPRFKAGDLLGIVPQGDSLPRLYSLASSSRDGFVEICVKKHAGGLCSGQLHRLQPGDTVQAFIRPNPDFAPQRKRPVILIGAGTGIGPLAGFIRNNRAGDRMHLYFGARHPDADLLYGEECQGWLDDGRLSDLRVAFSRLGQKTYVQDLLRGDAGRIAELAAEGAQILVCGGRAMADGVQAALAEALQPAGLSLATLKAEGRYVEDVY